MTTLPKPTSSTPRPNSGVDPAAGRAAQKLRAYLVSKDEVEVGVLGSGPGPFQSASRKRTSEVVFEDVQFASSHFLLERQVRDAMQGPASLEEVRQRLLALGFDLQAIPFGRGLLVPGSTPEDLPTELSRELDADVRELTAGEAPGEDGPQ